MIGIVNHIAENVQHFEQNKNEPITAPAQNAGFGVPKTVLWLMKHLVSNQVLWQKSSLSISCKTLCFMVESRPQMQAHLFFADTQTLKKTKRAYILPTFNRN